MLVASRYCSASNACSDANATAAIAAAADAAEQVGVRQRHLLRRDAVLQISAARSTTAACLVGLIARHSQQILLIA